MVSDKRVLTLSIKLGFGHDDLVADTTLDVLGSRAYRGR